MNTKPGRISLLDATRLRAGAIAGLAATAPMTLVMLAIRQVLPPAERYPLPPEQIAIELAAEARVFKFLDKRVRQSVTLLLHFAYGGAVGAVYALLAGKLSPAERPATLAVGGRRVRLDGAVGGTLYALAIWTVSYLGWLPALGMLRPATDHPARRNALMISAHVVWGATMALLLDRLVPGTSPSPPPGPAGQSGPVKLQTMPSPSSTGGTNDSESTTPGV